MATKKTKSRAKTASKKAVTKSSGTSNTSGAKKSPVSKTKSVAKTSPTTKRTTPEASTTKKTTSKKKTTAKTKTMTKTATKTTQAAAPKATAPKAKALEGYFGFTPYIPKKGEEYMSSTQRAHFKSILEAWKKQLMEEVDRTVHHMQDEAANYPDPSDRATQEEEFSLELRTRDRERKLIKKIDATLDKIKNDDYGFCDTCGIEIGIRRLEARPTANQCIDCKTLDEIKEKQTIG